MIEIRKVSRKFTRSTYPTTALEEVSTSIKEGEFVAIIGPSGSGKTTLLNLIGGLDTPDEGQIIIEGQDISELDDNALSKFRNHEIGFVFQEFHLEPFLKVRQNVLLPSYFNSAAPDLKEHADQLLREVGLEKKVKARINELSGGQKQRVAIARSLIQQPKILLADEPTGNLDLETGAQIIKLLRDLHKKHNTTLIIATHDEKIAQSAEKIIHIQDGKIID